MLRINILLDNQPLTWEELKQKYIKDPTLYTNAIKQANWLRKGLVKALLHSIASDLSPNPKATTFSAAGSTDLTSDFDVTVGGIFKEEVAILFNQQFTVLFKVPSATLFDTNIYGSGHVDSLDITQGESLECKGVFTCQTACSQKDSKCSLLSMLRFRQFSQLIENQHVWALATLVSTCSQKEYNEIIVPKISPHSFLLALLKRANSIKETNPRIGTVDQRNTHYANALRTIQALRRKFMSTPLLDQTQWIQAELDYANAESLAGWYAQEAYVTMGPFFQVVVIDQGQKQMEMFENEFIDSFIENMSFALHYFMEQENKRTCTRAFIKSSKYIARAAAAAEQVFSNFYASHLLHYMEVQQDNMQHLKKESTFIRSRRDELLKDITGESFEEKMIQYMKQVQCDKDVRSQLLTWTLDVLLNMFRFNHTSSNVSEVNSSAVIHPASLQVAE
jgi:hypothetical protein